MGLICHPISSWQRLIRVYYRGKQNLDISDLRHPKWDAENLMVQAWLINSMDVEIGRANIFLSTAKELWEALIETFFDHRNVAHLFEIKL